MKEKGLTQVALAAKLGVTQAAVSEFVNGRIPNGERFVKLAQCLGTTAEALLGLEPIEGTRPVEATADLSWSQLTDAEFDRDMDLYLSGPEAVLAKKRLTKALAASTSADDELRAAFEAYEPFRKQQAQMAEAMEAGFKRRDEERKKRAK